MQDDDQGSVSPNHMSASPEESDDDEVDELDDESEVGDDQEGSGSGDTPVDEGSTGHSDPTANSRVDVGANKKARASKRKHKDTPPTVRRKAEKHDRKIDLGLHDHKAHADCPDTLACLPDTNGRPQHTLPVILRCAILGSPRQRLTIREIYASMEAKYPYYKNAGQTWKVHRTMDLHLAFHIDYIYLFCSNLCAIIFHLIACSKGSLDLFLILGLVHTGQSI